MEKLKALIAQLKACAETMNEIENTTQYKGPVIDAGINLKLAIKYLERHARNEVQRAAAR